MDWLLEKTGLLGGFVKLSNRYTDEKGEATHVRLAAEEYDELQAEIASCREKLLQEQSDHRKQVEAIWNEAEDRIKEVETDAGKKLQAVEKRLEEAETEAEREKELNENLIRIMKERANAKRGMQPKKKNPGYRIAGKLSQAKASSSYDKKGVDVWTMTLETPYDGTIPFDQIKYRIFADLRGSYNGVGGILYNLEVYCFNAKGMPGILWKGPYDKVLKHCEGKGSCLYDYKFMVNQKSGLWEIQIFTTGPVRLLREML